MREQDFIQYQPIITGNPNGRVFILSIDLLTPIDNYATIFNIETSPSKYVFLDDFKIMIDANIATISFNSQQNLKSPGISPRKTTTPDELMKGFNPFGTSWNRNNSHRFMAPQKSKQHYGHIARLQEFRRSKHFLSQLESLAKWYITKINIKGFNTLVDILVNSIVNQAGIVTKSKNDKLPADLTQDPFGKSVQLYLKYHKHIPLNIKNALVVKLAFECVFSQLIGLQETIEKSQNGHNAECIKHPSEKPNIVIGFTNTDLYNLFKVFSEMSGHLQQYTIDCCDLTKPNMVNRLIRDEYNETQFFSLTRQVALTQRTGIRQENTSTNTNTDTDSHTYIQPSLL